MLIAALNENTMSKGDNVIEDCASKLCNLIRCAVKVVVNTTELAAHLVQMQSFAQHSAGMLAQ